MQQSDELTKTVDGVDTGIPSSADDDGDTGRLGGRFSAKAFLLSLVAVVAGVWAGGLIPIPIIDNLGSLAGVFVSTFVVGVLASESRYLENALAGAVTTGIMGLGFLTNASLPVILPLVERFGIAVSGIGVAAGVILGAGLGLAGHYFGRDLRDGLTREI